jgi:hypothetical protein
MYYPNDIEDICYEDDHIQAVLSEIKNNFPNEFKKFLESDNGNAVDDETIKKLGQKFGTVIKPKKAKVNIQKAFQLIIDEECR